MVRRLLLFAIVVATRTLRQTKSTLQRIILNRQPALFHLHTTIDIYLGIDQLSYVKNLLQPTAVQRAISPTKQAYFAFSPLDHRIMKPVKVQPPDSIIPTTML